MNRHLFDVDDFQAVSPEQPVKGREGEVAEVFVVDRVELDVVDHVLGIGYLNHRLPAGGQECLDPLDESIGVSNMSEHVVGQEQVGLLPLAAELFRQVGTEELINGVDAVLPGDPGNIPRGLNAHHRDALRHEVLEHVAVIAGRLDDQAVRTQSAAFDLFQALCLACSSSAGETLEKYRYSRNSTSGLTVWSI